MYQTAPKAMPIHTGALIARTHAALAHIPCLTGGTDQFVNERELLIGLLVRCLSSGRVHWRLVHFCLDNDFFPPLPIPLP